MSHFKFSTISKFLKPAAIIGILILLIYLPDAVFFVKNNVVNYLVIGVVVVGLMLLLPVFAFSGHLRIYYFLISFVVGLSPVSILPVLLINSQPNTEMLGLLLDTNPQEVLELLGFKLLIVLLMCVVMFWITYRICKLLPSNISYKKGLVISGVAAAFFLSAPLFRTTDLTYYKQILINTSKTYYPFRIGNAINYIYGELQNEDSYRKSVANFTFKATGGNTGKRNVHLLLIGETARADHFSINGYKRNTSPLLSKQEHLVSFSNVLSGGTMTAISVPLIITRADASDFDMHKKEKSILAAFKEVGYKTYWVSNQSKRGLTSNISMHYTDGDSTIFHSYGANESNFSGVTDSVLLPTLSNLIANHPNDDLLIVVHMIGSHWRYLLRYPESFTKFSPVSDRNRSMIGYPEKDVIVNEYDNSILFTDFIINAIIESLKQTNRQATITYVSDHGENLGDDNRNLFFHSYNPSKATASVPLFVWLSDQYISSNPAAITNLNRNKNVPISSAENIFYSLLDLAKISMPTYDSTKSYASAAFTPSDQLIIGENKAILKPSVIK